MTPPGFKRSLSKSQPPAGLSPAIAGLWWAAKDDWDKAHKIVMDEESADCAWVHAYLHRVEGDLDNARYWYRRAHHAPATGALPDEWDAIVATLLSAQQRGG
jgi:hypothetical protein